MIVQQFKTVVLLALLTALVLFVGRLLGGITGLVIAGAIVLIMNFGSYFFSDKIVLAMYHAQPAPKNSRLYESVARLSKKAGLPMPRVYILPQEQPNAFATGRSPKHAAVAATEGLLRMMDDDELDGVMAHELAHVKNYDTLITTIAATIAGVISYVATMAQWAAIFGGFGGRDNDNGGGIISLLIMAILAPIIAMLLQLAVSRSREYIADATGAKIAGKPDGLASALAKLEKGTAMIPMHDGTPATSSMFIANPFKKMPFGELFSTHPPMQKRIARLKGI